MVAEPVIALNRSLCAPIAGFDLHSLWQPGKRPDFLASRENPAIYRAISHGNMAQKAVRWQPGRKGSFAHTFPEEPTGEFRPWHYPIFLCVSSLSLASTLATSRTAGIRKWPTTSSVLAT